MSFIYVVLAVCVFYGRCTVPVCHLYFFFFRVSSFEVAIHTAAVSLKLIYLAAG